MPEQELGASIKYNPHLLGAEELRTIFVARKKELQQILDNISKTEVKTIPQHILITGHRGMGKSTLLQRVALAVNEDVTLSESWLPLRFPEEQYTVSTLAELWSNVLGVLADTLDENGETDHGIDALLEEIEQLVETTKKEGANVLCGGKRPSGFNKGYFYEPTVFDNVKDDFKIMIEEPFGPLTPLLTFKNFDEVIEKANNQVAGLAAYVCTNSIELASKTSEALETGMVAVNTPFISNAETPFGGIKQSGFGREGGSVGIKDYLNLKYTHLGIKS